MLGRRAALAAGLLAAGGALPARAQKSADTLRVTWRDAIPDIDPYHNQFRTGLVLAHHVWDCLVDRDPETFQLRPLLATGWRQVDDTTLSFALRDGVRFHDGSPFGAVDVVYTVQSVLADTALAVPSLFAWLAGAEKVDDTHVLLKLRQPFPAALEYLSMVLPILPAAYRARVGAAGFAQSPVGTGPYRVASTEGDRQLALERFEDYFPGSPKGRPAIGRIAIHEVSDAEAEFTDLLAERADWIWQIGPEQFDAIAHQPGLQAIKGEFDAARLYLIRRRRPQRRRKSADPDQGKAGGVPRA